MDKFIHHPHDMSIIFQEITRLRININEELMSKGHVECDHDKIIAWIDEFKEKLEEVRKYKHGRKKKDSTEKGRAEENKKKIGKTKKRKTAPKK